MNREDIKQKVKEKRNKMDGEYIEKLREEGLEDGVLDRIESYFETGKDTISFQEKLKYFGIKGYRSYEEYEVMREIEIMRYIESLGVTKIKEMAEYLDVSIRKAGRMNRHIRYKEGELEIDDETFEMLEKYKKGKSLEEIGVEYGMTRANVGYKLERVVPNYSHIYGDTSFNILQDKVKVERIKEEIKAGKPAYKIRIENKLPNVDIVKVIREEMEESGE